MPQLLCTHTPRVLLLFQAIKNLYLHFTIWLLLQAEDLIVVIDGEGARRLAARYEINASQELNKEQNYRLEMTDQSSGKIEVFDKASGHSIATRFTSGVTELDLDGYRMTLSGFADQDDFFDIGLNQSKSGDARNAGSTNFLE